MGGWFASQVTGTLPELCVRLALSTNCARTKSVPATALVYVNVACPDELVTPVPVRPVFGPLTTVKVTVLPKTGVPAVGVSVVAVAVKV